MLQRSAFRKSLLVTVSSFVLLASTAFADVAPVTVSSVQSSANTGAAATSIPIDVPPGRKGIQPNLALTYNSNSPNGWLGVGWSLDMGAIQRSTKRGVSYSANDYVFTSGGGSSELVARGDWGSNYYGAKSEGAFSKYYYDSSTGGWVVTTKDGTKYYYGTTAASRQDSALGVFKWSLDKVVDTNGNYMTVSYWKDQGEIYLDRIDYTGNGGVSPTNYVKFYREARTDAPAMYGSGSSVKTAYRLKTIDIVASGSRVHVTTLSYVNSGTSNVSLLLGVQHFGEDATIDAGGTVTSGSSLPATSVANHTAVNGSYTGWKFPYILRSVCSPYVGDFNGDGKADVLRACDDPNDNYVFLSTGTGITPGWPFNYNLRASSVPYLGDFNGDGKTDVLRVHDNPAYNYVFLSTGSGFDLTLNWPFNYNLKTGCEGRLGDFNGDGKTDVLRACDNAASNYVFLSTGSSFVEGWPFGYNLRAASVPYLGDFNGDGKTDVLRVHDNPAYNYVFLSTGSGFDLTLNWPFNYNMKTGCEGHLGDFNGDGKTDVLRACDNAASNYVFLSSGSRFIEGWPFNYNLRASSVPYLGDFNGDGKTDVLRAHDNPAYNYVFLSTGNGFDLSLNWSFNRDIKTTCLPYLGDFNGEGKVDVLRACANAWLNDVWLSTPSVTDLISTLTNGQGATTTITYKPSSSYTNGLLPFIVQTVQSIAVNDGNGNTSTTNYTYSGGQYDPTDREFRGFSYVKATAPNGATTETWFKQDAVYKGLPYDQIVKDSSGNTYSRTVNSYLSTTPYTGVSFPYLSQRDDYVYDGGTTYKRLTTGFTYDSYGNLTRKYHYGDAAVSGDERDENTEYSYDTANWIVSLPSHSWVLDSGGVKKAEGWFAYDVKGNLLTETRWLSGGANPVTTYTYDSYGNRATVKDAKNNTTTIAYDTVAQTYPVTITNALGHSATKTYDYRYGKPLTETDANGNSTSYTYDVFGRATRVTGPLDSGSTYGTVTYSYDNFGTVGSQRVTTYATEQSGTSNVIWSESYFDGLGRTFKTRKEGPDSKVIVSQNTFDQRGLVTAKSLPYFEGQETARWTTFTYDAVGRATRATNPDATYATTAYDKGRTTIINANGQQKVEEKDVYGRLVKVEEYNGGSLYATTNYQYDVMGNLRGTTDAKGNQSVINYDTLGRKTSMNDPDMGSWTYAYDANGNLTTQTDAKGQTITFAYDALNRITLKDYPAGAGTDAVYTYDETTSTNGKGRLTTLTDASGTSKYWYDAMGRATKSTRTIDSVAYTTETTYDALSRITSVKYPDNETVTYSYDTGGNLSQIGSYGTYAGYNALGQASTITYANGVTTTYQYLSTNNRLYSITTGIGTRGLMNTSYAYDNVGNILGITDYLDSGRNQTFGYDHLNRLTQAASTAYGTLSYGYNEIGNMTAKEGVIYTYPANGSARPHAVTATSDGKSYAYDNNGNMTTDGLRTIAYDYDNMPSSVTLGATTTSFVYDASGQRVKKITPTATTVYVGKLYECVGTSCTKYIMANGNKLAWKNSAGTFYYHQDHLGSSRVITDASGTKAEEITYLPYGATLTDSGNGTVSVEHRFTSQAYDAETGLYYYNARYYNPGLGRFVSADSIVPDPEDPQAFNRYSYTLNNPVIYTDPTGNATEFYATVSQTAYSGSSISISSSSSWFYTPSFYRPAPAPATKPAPKPAPAPARSSNVASTVGNSYSNFSLPTPVVNSISGLVNNVLIPVGSAVIPGWGAYDEFSEGNYLYGLFSLGTDLPIFKPAKWLVKGAGAVGDAIKGANRFATRPGEAVFWSGIRNGDVAASKWVAQHGGATLETTVAARGIELPVWDPSSPTVVDAWRQASKTFATGASGNVRVLQTDYVRINSAWAEVEFPALKANPNVTSIRAVNPETGVETLLWSK
ncbi:MAG: FG-GAP-like repeat-containing protein [Nitrospirota bacterium]|nr:FG-GAP-like repeat-containing protein [Nitrospirota bacterium]